MIASASRVERFNAAHRLHNPDWSDEKNESFYGLCNNPNYHGHNYKLVVKITGKVDPESGYFKEGKLDIKKEIVLFCAGGLRSALAAKSLKEMGFEKVSHIDGGFGALKQSKFKIA